MTSHELARRLFELPDVPVDVESISVVVLHPDGHSSVVADRDFLEGQEDVGRPNDPDGAEGIILNPLQTSRDRP